MSDLKKTGDSSLHADESFYADAETLRQRVGQENVNQSSVLASRRLDEALLRLDLAAGRKRDRTGSLPVGKVNAERQTATTNHDAIQPRHASTRTSDLELDESIHQSSAMWFEANDEERTKFRFDEPVSEIQPPAARSRSSSIDDQPAPSNPPASKPVPGNSSPSEPAAKTDRMKADSPVAAPTSAPEDPVSMLDASTPDSWTMLFASPIDVMISTSNGPRHPTPIEATAVKTTAVAANAVAANAVEATADETAKEAPQVSQPEPKASPELAGSTSELETFRATWQVDEFVVPSAVDELFLGGSIAEQLASRLAAARQDGLRTIAVTSARSGEGRSTVALGMALSVAFSGLKVAIVDADPAGVRLATDLHLDLDHSWLDSVRQTLPLEEAAVHSDADSLTLIPMLNRDNEPPMDYTDLRQLLRKLKTCFDLVVVDCGISAFAEVGLCDTALIVRDVHRTKALEVETLAMSLRRSGVQGVGVIENFCQG